MAGKKFEIKHTDERTICEGSKSSRWRGSLPSGMPAPHLIVVKMIHFSTNDSRVVLQQSPNSQSLSTAALRSGKRRLMHGKSIETQWFSRWCGGVGHNKRNIWGNGTNYCFTDVYTEIIRDLSTKELYTLRKSHFRLHIRAFKRDGFPRGSFSHPSKAIFHLEGHFPSVTPPTDRFRWLPLQLSHSGLQEESISMDAQWVRVILTSHFKTARGLLVTDLVILNLGQVKRTTPELAPPLQNTTLHQREDFELQCASMPITSVGTSEGTSVVKDSSEYDIYVTL
ncbi:hypothetical protein TNCV_4354401 [Trichonephila clavipes]|nr:hypothetical protein TNCV_4354401 [Trichonephila clavipes]